MKCNLLIACVLICSSALPQAKMKISPMKSVLVDYLKDSVEVRVDLVKAQTGVLYEYYSRVRTPVCEEQLCYNISIDIYWDLLGNFIRYELPADSPLTKFDHVEFTDEDHKKLRRILGDKTAVIRFFKADDLIDKTVQVKSKVVADAITSPTSPSIQSSVVSGAVYSTYTLWNIVNGKLADQMLKHTTSFMDTAMLSAWLHSDNVNYQYYALNKIPDEGVENYLSDILHLIVKGKNYVPYFAIDKIPLSVWRGHRFLHRILPLLEVCEFKMQNEILNRIKDVPFDKSTTALFIEKIGGLRDHQLVAALEIVAKEQADLSPASKSAVARLLSNKNATVVQLAHSILKHTH